VAVVVAFKAFKRLDEQIADEKRAGASIEFRGGGIEAVDERGFDPDMQHRV
jgi:hypothetical protein